MDKRVGSVQTHLRLITRDEIKNGPIPLEDLCFLWTENGPQGQQGESGPYLKTDVRRFLEEHPEFKEHFLVADIVQNKWMSPLEASFLSKKQKGEATGSIPSLPIKQVFHLLLHGQKSPGMDEATLKAKLDAKEVLYTDLMTSDDGKSWMRIFEYEPLNRRDEKNVEELPEGPNESSFQMSQIRILEQLEIDSEEREQEERTLVGLVTLTAIQRQQNKPQVEDTPLDENISGPTLAEKFTELLKRRKIMSLGLVLIVGIVAFWGMKGPTDFASLLGSITGSGAAPQKLTSEGASPVGSPGSAPNVPAKVLSFEEMQAKRSALNNKKNANGRPLSSAPSMPPATPSSELTTPVSPGGLGQALGIGQPPGSDASAGDDREGDVGTGPARRKNPGRKVTNQTRPEEKNEFESSSADEPATESEPAAEAEQQVPEDVEL